MLQSIQDKVQEKININLKNLFINIKKDIIFYNWHVKSYGWLIHSLTVTLT